MSELQTPHAKTRVHSEGMLCISPKLLRGKSGLTRVELALLAYIVENPDIGASRKELADDCCCAENSIPRAAKKLSELGLIEREARGAKHTLYRLKRNADVTVTLSERNTQVTRNIEVTEQRNNQVTVTVERNDDVTVSAKQSSKINERNIQVTATPEIPPTPPINNNSLSESRANPETPVFELEGGLGETKPKRTRAAKPKRTATEETMPTAMSDTMRENATKAGYLNGSGEALFRNWRDFHIGKGTLIANHEASFRTWIGNAPRYGNPPPSQKPQQARPRSGPPGIYPMNYRG